MRTEVDGGSVLEFPAFFRSDARPSAAKGAAGTLTHLDEHPSGAVTHDQIELTTAAAPIALHQREPLFFQKCKRPLFCGKPACKSQGAPSPMLDAGNSRSNCWS